MFTLEFDDAYTAEDSLYSAVLTLRTRDDTTVQGWAEQDSLVVHMSAYILSGSSVPEDEFMQFALAFGSANPFRDEAVLVLTMPNDGRASVQVYDVTGRRVRTLVEGGLPGRVSSCCVGRKGRLGQTVRFGRLSQPGDQRS